MERRIKSHVLFSHETFGEERDGDGGRGEE